MTVTKVYSALDELDAQIASLAESLGGTVEEIHERADRFELSDAELSVFGRMRNLEAMYELARRRR